VSLAPELDDELRKPFYSLVRANCFFGAPLMPKPEADTKPDAFDDLLDAGEQVDAGR
jgi:hypothetical protein